MQRVRGAAGLVRIITQLGALLVAVDGLHTHIDIQDPGMLEPRFPTPREGPWLPLGAALGIDPFESRSHTVLRANLLHAKALPIDLVPAQGGDVGVAAMAGQNGERDGSQ